MRRARRASTVCRASRAERKNLSNFGARMESPDAPHPAAFRALRHRDAAAHAPLDIDVLEGGAVHVRPAFQHPALPPPELVTAHLRTDPAYPDISSLPDRRTRSPQMLSYVVPFSRKRSPACTARGC